MKFLREKISGSIVLQMALLLPICAASFFVNLSTHEVSLMEARNFVAAREMVEFGHWWTPTLNGEIRISKPPLPTWLTALARIAGGNADSNRTMRLPAAAAACLLVLSTWGLTRVVSKDPQVPFMAAAILATTALAAIVGRSGSWDIYCHGFMAAAIWAFLSGIKNNGGIGRFLLAGFFLGLSFMSKGPVAFYALLFPFVPAYCLAFGCSEFKHHWRKIAVMLVLFIVLSSIWPLSVYLCNPDLSGSVLSAESRAWFTRHVRPLYFYGHFPLYTGIWLVVVLAGLMVPFAVKRFEDPAHYTFFLVWALLSLTLLTLFPEKKERYLLPGMIPLAVVAGYLFGGLLNASEQGSSSIGESRLVAIHGYVTGVAALILSGLVFFSCNATEPSGLLRPTLLVLPIIAAAIIFFHCGRRRSVGALFASSVAAMCFFNLFLLPAVYQSHLYWKNPAYVSLREVRNLPDIARLPTFHIGRPDPRVVWDVGKILKPTSVEIVCEKPEVSQFVLFADADIMDILDDCAGHRISALGQYHYKPRDMHKVKYLYLVESAGEQLINVDGSSIEAYSR